MLIALNNAGLSAYNTYYPGDLQRIVYFNGAAAWKHFFEQLIFDGEVGLIRDSVRPIHYLAIGH
jgi:hypothetical protein